MKKTLVAMLCGFVSIATAETVTVNGQVTPRKPITVPSSSADSLILDSSAGNQYSAGDNPTYKSLQAINSTSLSVAIGSLTIDANTASGDVDVFSFAGGTWNMNLCTLNFKNSAENNTANMKITLDRFVLTSSISQSQAIVFDKGKYTVKADTYNPNTAASGSSFDINADGHTSKLEIKSGADVSWAGKISFGKNGVLDISGKLSNNQLSIGAGATATIYSGGHLYNAAGGDSVNIAGTLDIKAGGTFQTVGGSHIIHSGTITSANIVDFYQIDKSTGTYTQTAGYTSFSRGANINSGAKWTVYEKVLLNGYITSQGTTSDAWTANVIINNGATFVIKNNENGNAGNAARIIFNGANNLILNKENAIVDENGDTVALTTMGGTKFNKMTVNANQQFTKLYIGKDASLDIVMADGVKLAFTGSSYSFNVANNNTDGYLRVFNFEENTISFEAPVVELIEQFIKLYGETEDDFLGYAKLNEAGFLTLVTVPEPAEWAMILGGIALGLAIYRRRK